MIEGLTFEPDGHIYTYKGVRFPSVTQILTPMLHLQGIPWHVLEAAADFGRNVHAAVHLYNQDDLDESELSKPLVPYLAAFKDFLSTTGFQISSSEGYVVNPRLGYCGQFDFTGTFDRTSWVVDIKTTAILPSTVGWQVAGYQAAMEMRPRKRACLWLRPGGKWEWIELKELSDFPMFVSALNLYAHNQKHFKRAEEWKL